MKAEQTQSIPKRSKEEIVQWLNAARQRKKTWEEEAQEELKSFLNERMRSRNSHYYDVAF